MALSDAHYNITIFFNSKSVKLYRTHPLTGGLILSLSLILHGHLPGKIYLFVPY